MCARADVPRQSILLYGPPGCGKSLLAHAMLNEASQQPFHVVLDNAELLQAPDTLMSSLETLRRYEMFGLVIDQVEEFLVALRSFPGAHQYLLEQLRSPTCVRVIVGTARRPEELHQNELNAFPHVLPLLFPDEKARLEILE